ncbi:MAG TPA: hypothetical protein VHX13_06690 [Acidobacteriaceae bacterium]|jgi:hypothetical protein|nr:hypothetical protein [Acidobacteriaceae bacterium]
MVRRWAVAGLILLLGGVVTTVSAKKKKDAEASRLFCQAQYAYVRTIDGDVLNPNVLPEDRDAANRMLDQIQGWKRYTIVYRPEEADLVFVVRTGRLASAQVLGSVAPREPYPGGSVNIGRNPGAATQNAQDPGAAGEYPMDRNGGGGVGAGAGVGPPDDLLQVYASGGGNDVHTMLWEHSQHNGLQGAQPLFEHLRDAVEATCKDAEKSGGSH